MRSEIDFINSIRHRGPQGYRIAAKRFADAKLAMAKGDAAVNLNFTHLVDRAVFKRRQLFRKRSLADLISTRRHVHVQSFMRSHMIVAVAPFIKTNLHRFKVAKDPLGQYFNFQTAMKAFVFALGLRMIRPTVANANAQEQEPNRQRRVLMLEVVSPRRPVIHQHALGQAITAKSGRKLLFYGPGLFVAAGLQAQRITRVIIEHSQRMTTRAVAQSKVAFEIHLPKLIGPLLLKPLVAALYFVSRRAHSSVAPQNSMHGAPGYRSLRRWWQTPFDLARAPAVSIANQEHLLLYLRGGAAGRMLWPARSVCQVYAARWLAPLQPFVSGLAADPKPLTQFAEIAPRLTGQRQKLL